eukprot:14181906-Ditylum_brightwellii.AAC.1
MMHHIPSLMHKWGHFKTFWMKTFGNYKLLHQLTTKEAGYGANMANHALENTPMIYDLENAKDNLMYAATASNNQIE